mgnify:FL=1
MKIINGKLVLETKNCINCMGTGHPLAMKTCPECKGSGNGKRGKVRGCRECFGKGKVVISERDESKACGHCEGNKIVPETIYDAVPKEIWESIEIRVNRNPQKRMGFNEQYLGVGYIVSCTDYGAAWQQNDDAALIADVRKNNTYVQATNLVNEKTLEVVHYIEVTVGRGGYTAKGHFNDGASPQEAFDDRMAGVLFPGHNVATLNRIG